MKILVMAGGVGRLVVGSASAHSTHGFRSSPEELLRESGPDYNRRAPVHDLVACVRVRFVEKQDSHDQRGYDARRLMGRRLIC